MEIGQLSIGRIELHILVFSQLPAFLLVAGQQQRYLLCRAKLLFQRTRFHNDEHSKDEFSLLLLLSRPQFYRSIFPSIQPSLVFFF